MKGTHQEESPMMKFAPQVTNSSKTYQVQQYNVKANNNKEAVSNTFSSMPAKGTITIVL